MATGAILQMADAVVAALNAHSFSAPYDAFLASKRLYIPVYALKDLNELKVTVVAASRATVLVDRGRIQEASYEIDVALQKKLQAPIDSPETQVQVDQLMALVEQVSDFLISMDGLPSATDTTNIIATPLAVTNEPVLDQRRLEEFSEFLTALTVTYREYR